MDFERSAEHAMLASSLDRFLSERYSFKTRMSVIASASGFSRDIWFQLVEIGVLAALFPPEGGGLGGQGFDIVTVFESLGKRLITEPILGHMMAARVLMAAQSDSRRDVLESLAEGWLTAAFAHDEQGEPNESATLKTCAARHPDGWRVQGRKTGVPYAAAVDLLVVSVSVAEGTALLLIPSSTPGLTMHSYPLIDGGHGADVVFDDVIVPGDALLIGPDCAVPVIEQVRGFGVLALCAEALGLMEIAKNDTLEFLQTRRQFDVALGSFQALRHRVADLIVDIEQARSAVINAAAALDKPRPERERALSAAKYTAGRVGIRVAEECIQLHGGIGMTWELPLAHYAKRLVMIDHQLGDEDYHLTRFMDFAGSVVVPVQATRPSA